MQVLAKTWHVWKTSKKAEKNLNNGQKMSQIGPKNVKK